MGGISIWQLAIIAVIVVLLFGTKKLRGLGGDLGSAVKGFKNAINDEKEQENVAEKKAVEDTSTGDASTKDKSQTKETDQA